MEVTFYIFRTWKYEIDQLNEKWQFKRHSKKLQKSATIFKFAMSENTKCHIFRQFPIV